MNEDRIVSEMSFAAECIGLSVSKSKIRDWLGELESYCLVKVNEKRDS